jgi:hypothetical protein
MPDLDEDEVEPFAAPVEGEDERFREMRRTANKAAKLSRENAALAAESAGLKQRLAFVDAGLTLTDKQRTALLAAHGQEDLSADALRATAVELGFAQAPEVDEQAEARETALATAARISSAASGARPPAAVPKVAERLAQAEAAGDHKLVQKIKAAELAKLVLSGQTGQIS